MSKRDTHRILTSWFKSAMGTKLPRPVETSIRLMTDTGLSPHLFLFIPRLRRIVISDAMADLPYLGAYFPYRLPPTPGTEDTDWKSLGWDGEPYMMLFPFIPAEWVWLHEFGHYLDDTFIQAIVRNEADSKFITESLDPTMLGEFIDLHHGMQEEFELRQHVAKATVADEYGDKALLNPKWCWKIPWDLVEQDAPSQYSYVSFGEWVAECFQTTCLRGRGEICGGNRGCAACDITSRTPKTTAFLQFFMSRKLFRKMSLKTSYPPVPELALAAAAAKV